MRNPSLWIQNATLVLPDRCLEQASILCVDGRIVRVGRRVRGTRNATVLDASGCFVAPGFVDLHVHGGGGADFMDATPDAIRYACRAHAKHGTTTLFPTTTTGSPECIQSMLDACRIVRDAPGAGEARIAGIHLYGPYFATEKVGCHDPDGRRDPDPAEYRRWFKDDLVRIATCAAELEGAVQFYRAAAKQGRLVTCGHSDADWAEMARAFRAGVRHVDHFWCAMSSVASLRKRFGTPMRASIEQFVLTHEEMSTEVIADGQHLSDELLEFANRMKGPQRLCLVTDANRALDCPPGRYRFGSQQEGTWFESNGHVGHVEGALASSVVGMDHMVRHMKKATSASLPEVIRMASLTPAERSGIAHECGSLEAGKRADLVILNRRLEVRQVLIAGQEVR